MTRVDNAVYVGPVHDPDKYRLDAQVGSGGEAALWRAQTSVSGAWETVAVKILSRGQQHRMDAWRNRWAEQVELLRLIHHPGVVGIHQHFEGAPMHRAGAAQTGNTTQLYLVMNWVEGPTLAEWRSLNNRPEDHFHRLRHLMQVADILTWLHRGDATSSGREIIHADLTPSNIIIGTNGQAVLVDFGLVRIARQSGQAAEGTRGYWAPEVLREGSYSPESDRYSFGALTYFVLTGEHPPEDPKAIRAGLARLPIVSETPGLLDHLMRMFSASPQDRPAPDEWIRAFRVVSTTTSSRVESDLAPPRPERRTGGRPDPTHVRRLLSAGGGVAALAALTISAMVWLPNRASSPTPTPSSSITSGEPSAAAPRVVVTATPTEMPNLIGSPADESATYLEGLGIKVHTTYKWDEEVEESAVIRQLPKAGAPLTTVVRLVAARRPETLSLAAVEKLDGTTPGYGSWTLDDGKTYPNSASFANCSYSSGYAGMENTTEYDLRRRFEEFRATIGLGPAAKHTSGKFAVFVDGERKYARTLSYGETDNVQVNLAGAERLEIHSDCNNDADTAAQVWGNARVFFKP